MRHLPVGPAPRSAHDAEQLVDFHCCDEGLDRCRSSGCGLWFGASPLGEDQAFVGGVGRGNYLQRQRVTLSDDEDGGTGAGPAADQRPTLATRPMAQTPQL